MIVTEMIKRKYKICSLPLLVVINTVLFKYQITYIILRYFYKRPIYYWSLYKRNCCISSSGRAYELHKKFSIGTEFLPILINLFPFVRIYSFIGTNKVNKSLL